VQKAMLIAIQNITIKQGRSALPLKLLSLNMHLSSQLSKHCFFFAVKSAVSLFV
jgi:hypothetical protein